MYDVITEVPEVKIFSEKKNLQIDSKWSETCKKHEPTNSSAADDRFRWPIFPVEYYVSTYKLPYNISSK